MKSLRTATTVFFLIYLLPVLLSSCKKDDVGSTADPATVVTYSTAQLSGNLLDENSLSSLKLWPTLATRKGIINLNNNGATFTGNTDGRYAIYQMISLPARKFYRVSITASYSLNNYSPAGIYMMDSTMTTTLGEYEQVSSSGSGQTWQFVFYCRKPGTMALVIGFLNGINGTVKFSNVALTEYSYQPKLSGSAFSAYLAKKFPLPFTGREYDSTINKIADYMNSVLLCRYEYYADTVEQPILDGLIGSDTAYAYFNEFRHTPDSITDSYCQKSSLSLGEILTNEFNIPVRQIYMAIGGIGKHQFLEYWNPFAGKWIIIDPCFNARYAKNGVLLGDEEIDQSTAPGLIIRYGQYFYYQTTDDLVTLWQELEILDVKDYYSVTFPFS